MAIGDALTAHTFELSLGQFQVETVQSIDGLTIGQDVIEVNDSTTVQDLVGEVKPKVVQPGTITLALPTEQAQALASAAEDSTPELAVLRISDATGHVRRIKLMQGWVSRWEGPSLGAGQSSGDTESVTITFEEIVVE
ncbi:phage tail protein [Kitasatospora sp. NPDC059973]|uniref:phage tail protein n=1 Tax=Kitasatospora sp. NPDC059973 TaxID=3347020 RepID=UPI0036738645